MGYLVDGFKNYVNFEGRATRKQFWFFTLWIYALIFIATIIDLLIGTTELLGGYGLITGILGLAILLPNLAITIRRLHDIGKNGLWVLINIIPIVGPIILIVLLCKRSNPGLNEYGPPAENTVTEDSVESKYVRVEQDS